VASSSSRRNSSARSENTTPKPNVASAEFCSTMVTSVSGRRRLIKYARYSPAVPAPRMAMCIAQEYYRLAGAAAAKIVAARALGSTGKDERIDFATADADVLELTVAKRSQLGSGDGPGAART